MSIMETPNSKKQEIRRQLAADMAEFLAAGGEIQTDGQRYQPLTSGVDKEDRIKATCAAMILGFPEAAILQSFRTGLLGGHPAPEFIRHRATGARLYLREAVYRWLDKHGRSGSKGKPKPHDNLLNATEVAHLSGLSRATISKNKTAGKLPEMVKGLDSHYYWRESDILAWMDTRKQEQAA